QRNTCLNLAEVRWTEKSERRLLRIIKLITSRFSVGNDPLQVFEIAIDEIDALPTDRQPRPTVDPWTPAIKTRDYRSGCVIDRSSQCANAFNRKRRCFGVINVEIDIGRRLSPPSRM